MTQESEDALTEIDRLIRVDQWHEQLVATCRSVVINLGDNEKGNETPRKVEGEYPSINVANAFFSAKTILVRLGEPLEASMVDGA